MSKAKMFRRAHDKIVDTLQGEIDVLVGRADGELEALAVNTFGVPDPAANTLFAPPAKPVKVRCLHCGGRYLSDKMRLEYHPRMQAILCDGIGEGIAELLPLWWCKNTYCDGAGFGHDLHEMKVASSRRRVA